MDEKRHTGPNLQLVSTLPEEDEYPPLEDDLVKLHDQGPIKLPMAPDLDELIQKVTKTFSKPSATGAGESTSGTHDFTQRDQEELNGRLFSDELLGLEGYKTPDSDIQEKEAANPDVPQPPPKQKKNVAVSKQKGVLPEEGYYRPGEDEVEAVRDTYTGKHRQAAWAQRKIGNLKTYLPGAKEQILEKQQIVRQLGAAATRRTVDLTKKYAPRAKEQAREKRQQASRLGAVALNAITLQTAKLYNGIARYQERVFFNSETGENNQSLLAIGAFAVMTVGVGYIMSKTLSGHGHDVFFFGHHHVGHQPGSGGHHAVQHHLGGGSHRPGGNGSAEGRGGGGNLPLPKEKPGPPHIYEIVRLHKDGNTWNSVQSFANSLGHANLSDHDTYELTKATLKLNNVSWDQAHYLPVGFKLQMLHPEQIRQILESSKS